MEIDTDMSDNEHDSTMFSAEDIPKIVQFFKEADADGGGGLDLEEFCEVVHKFHNVKTKEEIIALHMKIDTNCDGTVDIGELLNFMRTKSEAVNHKYEPFPNPPNVTPVDCDKAITQMLFRCFDNEVQRNMDPVLEQVRPFRDGEYFSITSNGIVTFWSDTLDHKYTIPIGTNKTKLPFAHKEKISISDMVYLPELQELAISTSDRELLFYTCDDIHSEFKVSLALIIEDRVTAMNYWSDGTKSLFSFGDIQGFLYVFISYDVKTNGLFYKGCYEDISLQNYATIYLKNVLKTNNKSFLNLKVGIFNDMCRQIKYIPQLNSYAVCGLSSKTMVLATLSEPPRRGLTKTIFESKMYKEFFTCVEYSPLNESLLTGGTDGLLRVWFPHNTTLCEEVLEGHVAPITHLTLNPKDRIFVSLSMDKNVRVWSTDGWSCLQSFQVEDMGRAKISSMCYNIQNNELVLANSDIAKILGRGTDVFKEKLKTHHKPLCCALYHSIFKQVVSVCQDGVVKVWDILTGKTVMEFKVTPERHVGLTAMKFDAPQRRLITISQDGKVRLWNFNNGEELAVHPVTVHKQVTGIICLKDRLYVSGRNSRIIFDLDLEKSDNKFLEHDYLSDISSMDVHNNTLVTASSNGNIVIFDTDTAKALYWLNTTTSPRTYEINNGARGLQGSLSDAKSQNYIKHTGKSALKTTELVPNISPLILCLKTREANGNIATLLTSADGDISAWSVDRKGGLLRKFRAVSGEGAVITTMSTDESGQILLAGDSTGKIYLWDIQEFGCGKKAEEGPFEYINGRRVSVCPPPLIRSWQSHYLAVVSVRCGAASNNIITAGLDCNVKLWTNTGYCIGIFRKDEWDATQLNPEDILLSPDPEQHGIPSTAETKDIQDMPVPDSKTSSWPTPPIRALEHSVRDLQGTDFMEEDDKWLDFTRENNKKLRERLDKLNDLTASVNEKYDKFFFKRIKNERIKQKYKKQRDNCIQRPPEVTVQKESTHNPQITTPYTDCTATNSSPHVQQSIVRPNKHKPHPPQNPLVRSGSDPRTCSPQTASPCLNQISSKFERVLKIQQRDTLEGSFLKPCPPNSLLGKEESDLKSKHVPIPPTNDKDMDKPTHRTQFKPHPPPARLTTGCNDATKKLLNVKPSANTAKCGSDHTQKDLHLPPISDKVQLTYHQSQFKPHPPQSPPTTGHTNVIRSSARLHRLRH